MGLNPTAASKLDKIEKRYTLKHLLLAISLEGPYDKFFKKINN